MATGSSGNKIQSGGLLEDPGGMCESAIRLIKAGIRKNGLVLILVLGFSNNLKAQTIIPYGNNPAAGKYIRLNGVKHYFEVYGQGKPLLLLHGNSTGISGFAAQISHFSKKYRVYALENRGRGHSDPGPDSLNFKQMANDVAAFIQLMQLDSVTVLGKSDGGIIGIFLGIYYPAHISRIVAFGANMWPDSTALYPIVVQKIHSERVEAEKMVSLGDTTKNWKQEVRRLRLDEFQPNIHASDLQQIKVPVLVVSCDRDVIREEHTLYIYQHIPLADLCILPGETHHVPKENPALFNAMVDKFLSKEFQGDPLRFK